MVYHVRFRFGSPGTVCGPVHLAFCQSGIRLRMVQIFQLYSTAVLSEFMRQSRSHAHDEMAANLNQIIEVKVIFLSFFKMGIMIYNFIDQ